MKQHRLSLFPFARLTICLATATMLGGCESSSSTTTTTTSTQSTTQSSSPADQSNLRSVAPTAGSMNGNLSGVPRNTMGH